MAKIFYAKIIHSKIQPELVVILETSSNPNDSMTYGEKRHACIKWTNSSKKLFCTEYVHCHSQTGDSKTGMLVCIYFSLIWKINRSKKKKIKYNHLLKMGPILMRGWSWSGPCPAKSWMDHTRLCRLVPDRTWISQGKESYSEWN